MTFAPKLAIVSIVLVVVTGCYTVGTGSDADGSAPMIGKVFFAQHHVQEPADPLSRLVGDLEALIKVQVYSNKPRKAPAVVAVLQLDDTSDELFLSGPDMLPKPYTGEPKLMPQSYDDSFTGMIPKEWIKPGLKVTVELRGYSYTHKYNPPGNTGVTVLDRKVIDDLIVGAGNKLLLTSFDIHFFKEETGVDFPRGWEIEMQDKLPVAEFKVQRVRGIVFPEVIMPNGVRYTSVKDFETRQGRRFEGESKAARYWMRALKRAGGRNYDHGVIFLNLASVDANGWGERKSLAGTTDLGRMGNFIHEMGHVFSLPHWNEDKRYPYVGEMYGVPGPGRKLRAQHVGPTWAFSLHRGTFISPFVQEDERVGGAVGCYKRDPMQGGGYGDQETNYMMRHFSDYSVYQMQKYMEKKMLFWDENRKSYYQWNEETKSFSTKLESDGWNLADNPFEDVISVMVSASAVMPTANYVYPPIGPYKAGLLTLFDANSAEDRQKAKSFGFSDESCDLCLRVTQGGVTRTYLLEAKLNPEAEPMKDGAFVTTAINLPVKAGKLTSIDLIHAPDVISKGVTDSAKQLYHWGD